MRIKDWTSLLIFTWNVNNIWTIHHVRLFLLSLSRFWKLVTFARAILETVTFAKVILETGAFARAILEICHICQGDIGNCHICQSDIGNCRICQGNIGNLSHCHCDIGNCHILPGHCGKPRILHRCNIGNWSNLLGLCGKLWHSIVSLLETGTLARTILETVTSCYVVLGSGILPGYCTHPLHYIGQGVIGNGPFWTGHSRKLHFTRALWETVAFDRCIIGSWHIGQGVIGICHLFPSRSWKLHFTKAFWEIAPFYRGIIGSRHIYLGNIGNGL